MQPQDRPGAGSDRSTARHALYPHWCGNLSRHAPHGTCNGFGYDAGPGCHDRTCRLCRPAEEPNGG